MGFKFWRIGGFFPPTGLFWDAINHFLGIETTTPIARLDIRDDAYLINLMSIGSDNNFNNSSGCMLIGAANSIDCSYSGVFGIGNAISASSAVYAVGANNVIDMPSGYALIFGSQNQDFSENFSSYGDLILGESNIATETSSNSLFIGHSNTTSSYNSIAIGDLFNITADNAIAIGINFGNVDITERNSCVIMSEKFGIGESAPASTLVIKGLPTSSAGLQSGAVWCDTSAGNVLKMV